MRDKAEAEVALVVKDRTAARQSARQENPVTLHQRKRTFGRGALIFADHDGFSVLPEKEDRFSLFNGFGEVFFNGEMQVRVAEGRSINRKISHHEPIIHGREVFVKAVFEKTKRCYVIT